MRLFDIKSQQVLESSFKIMNVENMIILDLKFKQFELKFLLKKISRTFVEKFCSMNKIVDNRINTVNCCTCAYLMLRWCTLLTRISWDPLLDPQPHTVLSLMLLRSSLVMMGLVGVQQSVFLNAILYLALITLYRIGFAVVLK